MDEDAALEAGRVAGLATLAIGSALLVAPRRVGALSGVHDARTARVLGLVDLALAPGLIAGRPRWPWLAARSAANLAMATVVARGGRAGLATAVGLVGVTAVDARAALTLHAVGR